MSFKKIPRLELSRNETRDFRRKIILGVKLLQKQNLKVRHGKPLILNNRGTGR